MQTCHVPHTNRTFNALSGNTITVMSPDGKPIQVNASALQSAGAQMASGTLEIIDKLATNVVNKKCQ